MVKVAIEKSWERVLADEFARTYFRDLTDRVRSAYQSAQPVYPAPKNIFNAFTLCPFDTVKVVILGQDPYHGPQQAHGLCFSVPDDVPIPPSLQNIYKELLSDIGTPISKSGNLERWARQGVLLLNATLTVAAAQAGSHQGWGWEQFTDAVIRKISEEKEQVVFILWGRYAQAKGAHIDSRKHLILKSAHPSPLSAHNGFFGSRPFSQTNTYLEAHGKTSIVW